MDDLATVYREEIAGLARLGATYVQLDEVPLAMLCAPGVWEQVRARGDDPDRLVDLYIRAINLATEPRPAGVTVAMHLCRGNYKGKWIAEGGYDAVARDSGEPEASDRRGLGAPPARSTGREPTVRIREHRHRQPGHRGRRAAEARARRPGRPRGLGSTPSRNSPRRCQAAAARAMARRRRAVASRSRTCRGREVSTGVTGAVL